MLNGDTKSGATPFVIAVMLKSYSRKWCTGEIDMMG
jgi:hypothetical protein